MNKQNTRHIHTAARALAALLLLSAAAQQAHAGDKITMNYNGETAGNNGSNGYSALPSFIRLANSVDFSKTYSWNDLATTIPIKKLR